MKSTFEACAIFAGEDTSVEALRIPFSESIRPQIEKYLDDQLKVFESLEPVDYDGRYKADDDECLTIENYKDPGNVIQNVCKFINGEAALELSSVDELDSCRAFVFSISSHPDKLLLQRFSRTLIAKKDRYFGIYDEKTFSSIRESAVALATSLTAVYEINSKKLHFKNVKSIRSAIPGFDEVYAPGADLNMIRDFFSNPLFETNSAREIAKKDSSTIARLVWLIHESGVDIKTKLPKLRQIDGLLNMRCFEGALIKLPSEVLKVKVLLGVFIGDVFVQDNKVYLTNSKRAIPPFA